MSLPTELKTSTEASVLPQNNLASWSKVTFSTRHTPESGLNTLVDCSAAVFGHIQALTQKPLSNDTRKNIVEYLETLQKHYQQLGYSQDIALAAHYLICATLDDILKCIGSDGQFLQSFHNSRLEQEKFYSILEHISSQSDKYIDLLELVYLCLRFGYKGQYRNTPFGLQQWSLLTDNTYHLIAKARGRHSNGLSPNLSSLPSNSLQSLPEATPHSTTLTHRHFYLLTVFLFILLAVVASFIFRQAYNTTREALVTPNVAATPHKSQESVA